MSPPPPLPLAALWSLAGVTALSCVLALIALNGGGSVAVGPMPLMRIAAGYDRAAERLLSAGRGPDPAVRANALQASRDALSQYPYDTSAWLRLAYLDALAHKGLTSTGVADLQRSYDLVAVDSFVGLWRIRFALENSQALSPELRQEVRTEAFALWRNGENRPALQSMAREIHNPAGRLSLALWLSRLQAAPN